MYPSQETTHCFIFQPAWPIYKEFEKRIAYTNACDIYSCTLAVTLAMAWGWLLQGSPTPPSKLHPFPPWKSYNETYKGLELHTPLRRFHMNPVVMGHVDVLLHVVTYHQPFRWCYSVRFVIWRSQSWSGGLEEEHECWKGPDSKAPMSQKLPPKTQFTIYADVGWEPRVFFPNFKFRCREIWKGKDEKWWKLQDFGDLKHP